MTEEETDRDWLIRRMAKKAQLEEEDLIRSVVRIRRPVDDHEKKRGGAYSLPADFRYPVAYDGRPISASGKTSFHFNLISISKTATYGDNKPPFVTVINSGTGSGQVSKPGDHEDYIGRDGAVMETGTEGYGDYIEAGASGTRAIISNISTDPAARKRFWDAVVRAERTPRRDRMIINLSKIPDQWRVRAINLLAKCKDLSQDDRAKLEEVLEWKWSEPTVEIDIPRKHFYQFRAKLKRQSIWTEEVAGLRPGRGGRVQYRIVAELPDGLSDEARLEILRAFSARLDALNVMYTAVIHEPDEHNDRRNYHLHIAFYDRPCEYLVEEGCWDFELRTPVPGQRGRSKAAKRQNKNKVIAQPAEGQSVKDHGREFMKSLRSDYASICNVLLAGSGSNRLFDPRSFEAMGIEQEPSVHLGRAEKLDSAGVPTKDGVLNAERTWQGAFKRAEETLKASMAERTRALQSGEEAIGALKAQNTSHTKAADLISSLASLREMAGDLSRWERQAMQIQLTKGMLYSRAHKTEQRCRRQLGGDAGTKSERQQSQIAQRLKEAVAYREMLDREFMIDLQRAEFDHARLEALQAKAARLVKQIDALTQAIGEAPSTRELLVEPTGIASVEKRSRLTKRERDQVGKMYEDFSSYERRWDAIIQKIIDDGLPIQPPAEAGAPYTVPGIAKADLDILLNPILDQRTQARLRGIFESRLERGEIGGPGAEAEAVAEITPPVQVVPRVEQPPAPLDGKWDQLRDQALAKHAEDRNDAINRVAMRIKVAQNDNFAVTFVDNVPRLALSAFKRLTPEDRHFAKYMKDPIDERFTTYLIECRRRFSDILKNNPSACIVGGQRILALMKNFPRDLHPHLDWLVEDPTLKAEFDRMREQARAARKLEAAKRSQDASRGPGIESSVEKIAPDLAPDIQPGENAPSATDPSPDCERWKDLQRGGGRG
ncbi:MobA/MobL family protein [Sphingomicrobium nitratireducens]|uniref:MobA/MobL family protein n=1 Tax=Sphingomicrobium nitratireducens TaxID=2964666 RepID=UPI0022406283|nr:MobA/MobL family protein [Sphingomicrobium nitratireducens]